MEPNNLAPILHHANWIADSPVVAVEYPLCSPGIPEELLLQLDPWLNLFVGKTTEAAIPLVQARWSNLLHPQVRRLRDYLTAFVPRSIFTHEERCWLVITDPKFMSSAETETVGDCWFIAPPPNPAVITQILESKGFGQVVGLHEFFVAFSGLQEDGVIQGDFTRVENLKRLDEFPEGELWALPEDVERWSTSAPFYWSRNGDFILLSSEGETAWVDHEMNEIRTLTETFSDFLNYYINYVSHRYPFSSWEPWSDV